MFHKGSKMSGDCFGIKNRAIKKSIKPVPELSNLGIFTLFKTYKITNRRMDICYL